MSSTYIGDLSAIENVYTTRTETTSSGKGKSSLSMDDFLQLMVVQFQNQTIDSTADTSDMLNQLVQMSVVQAISEISESVDNLTDSNVMTYAASLVGKQVTVASYDEQGNLLEKVGTVTGTAVYNGNHILYLDGENTAYSLGTLMAVGRLPDETSAGGTTEDAAASTEESAGESSEGTTEEA